MTTHVTPDRDILYHAIRDRYTEVALNPERTFHFHHGRPLAQILDYPMSQVDAMPPIAGLRSCLGIASTCRSMNESYKGYRVTIPWQFRIGIG